MQERGYIHQCSDLAGLDEKARSGDLVAYIGFDCTAPSLHVGSLVPIMMLHWLQETGGKPVALMGGGTTMVGDPSGKDESRKLLTVEAIEANKAGIRRAFAHFITFGDGKTDAIMPDNADWLAKLNYIDFLRDVGRHFSVNRMLAMDSVKLRLDREHELTFLEFNYMCLQAYDFTELYRRYGVTLQMGGSDQWGNIVTGIDLGRRMGLDAALRPDLAADHHGLGGEDGQDRRRGGLARRLDAEPLRLLAVLAQHRGFRRRPVPEALHPAADRRDPASRIPSGGRDQRGEESARQRGDGPPARVRGGAVGRRDGAQDLRGRRAGREPADGRRAGRASSTRASARSRPSCAPASSPRPAKRAVRSAAAACA